MVKLGVSKRARLIKALWSEKFEKVDRKNEEKWGGKICNSRLKQWMKMLEEVTGGDKDAEKMGTVKANLLALK